MLVFLFFREQALTVPTFVDKILLQTSGNISGQSIESVLSNEHSIATTDLSTPMPQSNLEVMWGKLSSDNNSSIQV